MDKPRPRKFKVFQARFGFHDTVVAAPSQAAALRAWGTHQNLFATGDARIATDADAIAAATRHPEQPLRRPLGSNDPFSLQPTSLPTLPDVPRPRTPQRGREAQPPRQKPDRSKLDEAETALRELDARRKREDQELQREAASLQARRTAAQEKYNDARSTACAAVIAARTKFRKAGGSF